MENTIFKPIDINVDLMKAVLSKKQFEVANEAGDELSLRLEDVIVLTVKGEEQRYYVMKTGGGECEVFQATEDGGVAALLLITDPDICDLVCIKLIRRLLNKFDDLAKDAAELAASLKDEDHDGDEEEDDDDGYDEDDEGDEEEDEDEVDDDEDDGEYKLFALDSTYTVVRDNKDADMDGKSIANIMFDKDNKEPITLRDEHGTCVTFDQIAVIVRDDNFYWILKPIDKMLGFDDTDAFAFKVYQDEKGKIIIQIELDEEVASAVFDEYYRLLRGE